MSGSDEPPIPPPTGGFTFSGLPPTPGEPTPPLPYAATPPERARVRVPAGSSNERLGTLTTDNVANFVARIGLGTGNQLSSTSYQFTPVTRMQQLLEWAYRGSWIVGAAVDVVAEDMTRARVSFDMDIDPDDLAQIENTINDICLWQNLADTIRWSRLYGGAVMVMLIDGQDMSTELHVDRIKKDQLRGFLVLDRWMLSPTSTAQITDPGPDYGLPMHYDVVATSPYLPKMHIHHSRVMRMDGTTLPFRQRIAENGWGMSVLERLYDRLLAFDSGTMGAAQLLYRAYIRTMKVKGYRALVGVGGAMQEGFVKSMELMRLMQSNEGMTVIDAEDEFETHAYTFGGISDTLMVLGQQISGALGIPLTRLFGQSPQGMNATGDSDIRLYYDMIRALQEARLRRPMHKIFEVLVRSSLGVAPPKNWNFSFGPLWQLDEVQKSEMAARDAETVVKLHEAGIYSTTMALKELRTAATLTGRFAVISDEDIEDSEAIPPPWDPETIEQQKQMQEQQLAQGEQGLAQGEQGLAAPDDGPGDDHAQSETGGDK
jgi:hypothetical protein